MSWQFPFPGDSPVASRNLDLYCANAGRKNSARIELPSGTYIPKFRWQLDGDREGIPGLGWHGLGVNSLVKRLGGCDLIAASRLSALFARWQRPFNVKLGGEVSLEDLRSSATILVGYSYTRWKEISQDLRYFIDMSRMPPWNRR